MTDKEKRDNSESELDMLINELVVELGILRGHLRRIAEFGELGKFDLVQSSLRETGKGWGLLVKSIEDVKRLDARAVQFLAKIERKAYLKNIGRKTFARGSLRAGLGRK